MPRQRYPIRRGNPRCFTLDDDAHQLLHAMSPNSKGIGLLISELIRREARERAERPALLAALAAAGGDSAEDGA
jgi:hypothetical protein